MLVSLDRYLMLLLRQFHLEHIQSLAEALTTAGGCEGDRGRETPGRDGESEGESDRRLLAGKMRGGERKVCMMAA